MEKGNKLKKKIRDIFKLHVINDNHEISSLENRGERIDIDYRNRINFKKFNIYQKAHYKRYEFARSVIPFGKIVGDMACGTGYGSVILSGISKNVIGVDCDKSVIEVIQERYKKVGNVTFICENLLNLNFHSFFDNIVSFETIEHFEETDIIRLFNIFHRSLKKDGKIIFSTPYMQEESLEAKQMGFHLTYNIDENTIIEWLGSLYTVEVMKFQNYQTSTIEQFLDDKDFIICIAKKL